MKKLVTLAGILLLAGAGCSTSSTGSGNISTSDYSLSLPAGVTLQELDFADGYRFQNFDDSGDPSTYPDNAFYTEITGGNTEADFTNVYPTVMESTLGVNDTPVSLASEYATGDGVFMEDAYFHAPSGTLIVEHYFSQSGLAAAEAALSGISFN